MNLYHMQMSVEDAERKCLNYGDGLAIVDTAEKRQKLAEFIDAYGTSKSTHFSNYFKCSINTQPCYFHLDDEYYWVGASDVGRKAGDFYWRDGTKLDNTLFAKGDPNQFKEGQKTCVNFAFTLLYDYECSSTYYRPICHIGNLNLLTK